LFVSTKSNVAAVGLPEFNPALFDPQDSVKLDLTDEFALKDKPKELIERLDIILAGGQLSEETKETILQAITPLAPYDDYSVRAALYLIMLSPDYNIRK